MKDFKKMVKMADGGRVKKMAEGKSTGKLADIKPEEFKPEFVKSLTDKSVRERMMAQAKADEPSLRKSREDYNKATDEVVKRTQPNMANMNPMGDTYKRGGKVKRGMKK